MFRNYITYDGAALAFSALFALLFQYLYGQSIGIITFLVLVVTLLGIIPILSTGSEFNDKE